MSAPNQTTWPRELGLAAATAVAGALLPVHRWPRPAQWALHGGLGISAAGATAWLVRLKASEAPPETPGAAEEHEPFGVAATAGIAAAVGTLAVASSVGGTALDRAIEHSLTRRGVARPRWWLGAAAGLVSLATGALERGARPAGRQA